MTKLYKKNGAVFIPAGITFEEVEKLKDDNKIKKYFMKKIFLI